MNFHPFSEKHRFPASPLPQKGDTGGGTWGTAFLWPATVHSLKKVVSFEVGGSGEAGKRKNAKCLIRFTGGSKNENAQWLERR